MDKATLIQRISDAYAVDPDYPWASTPEAAVFRHPNNRKWFALWMRVANAHLGLPGDGARDVLNVKCDPVLIGSLRGQPGYLPAYHMNKSQWITLVMDVLPDDDIMALVAMSFALTRPKRR